MMWYRTERPIWLRLGVGVLLPVIAAVIRWHFLETLGFRATFTTFYPAVAVAALYGRFGAGFIATAVSALLADYFWIEPVGQFAIAPFADRLSVAVFLANGTLISCLAEAAYRAQARAFKTEQQSRLSAEREKAAVELQQSERKYRELVQNANSAIVRWNSDGTIAFFNEYAQTFFGYREDEILGKHVSVLLPETESIGTDSTALALDVVRYPERYVSNINENIRRDGSRVWMAWTHKAIFDESGAVSEILAVGTDITARRQAEERLKHASEFAKAILDTVDGLIIVLDRNGRIVRFNAACERLTGWRVDEVIGRCFWEFLVPEEQRRGVLQVFQDLTAGKLPSRHENEWILRDGSRRWITWANSCLLDAKGDIVHVIGTGIDITERQRAEQALRESERLARDQEAQIMAILDAAPAMIWTAHDRECRSISGNQAARELSRVDETANMSKTGPEREHLAHYSIYKDGRELAPEELPIQVVASTGREFRDYSLEFVLKDGPRYSLLGNVIPLIDSEGSPSGAIAAFMDITERKLMEEELRKSRDELEIRVRERTEELAAERQLFFDVLETLPVYVCLLTPEYHVPFANKVFRDRFGASKGLRCFEHLFGRSEPCEICDTYAVLKTSTPHRWEWEGPDGRSYSVFDFPFIDAKGSQLILEMGIDVTERKQAEEALKTERQRLFDVLETLPVMICLLTPDHHVAFSNRSFREKFGESQGRHCYEYRFGLNEPCNFCESYKVVETGRPHHWEVTVPDGTIIDAHDFPFIDVDGSPMILEMDFDITEFREAERELKATVAKLEQLNQELQEFAFIASHDLQEPLRKIQTFGEMLVRRKKDFLDAEGKNLLERIIKGANRMAELLHALRTYSRSGTSQLIHKPVSLAEVARGAASALEYWISKTNAKVEIGDLPTVDADESLLHQLFQNLISNSIKYRKESEPPIIKISGSVIDHQCRISVQDNGIGFDPCYSDQIFKPFQRLHGKDSPYSGTGMGLTICRKIVARHNGEITVESEPGRGSTFKVTLPLKQQKRA